MDGLLSSALFPSYHPSYGRRQVLMDGLLSCSLAPTLPPNPTPTPTLTLP